MAFGETSTFNFCFFRCPIKSLLLDFPFVGQLLFKIHKSGSWSQIIHPTTKFGIFSVLLWWSSSLLLAKSLSCFFSDCAIGISKLEFLKLEFFFQAESQNWNFFSLYDLFYFNVLGILKRARKKQHDIYFLNLVYINLLRFGISFLVTENNRSNNVNRVRYKVFFFFFSEKRVRYKLNTNILQNIKNN